MSAQSSTGTGQGDAENLMRGLSISNLPKVTNPAGQLAFKVIDNKVVALLVSGGEATPISTINGVGGDDDNELTLTAGAGMVITTDVDNNEIILESTGGVGTYTNLTPVPQTLGGVLIGSTFNNVTFSDMFDTLLYPYLAPAFTSFTISGQATVLEVGDSITSGAKTFTWSTSNSSNVSANTIQIENFTDSTVLGSGLANDGTEGINLSSPITKTTVTSHTFRIQGTNTQSNTFSTNFEVNWRFRYYYGTSTNTILTESQVEALSGSALGTSLAGTFSFAGGGYKYFAIPTTFSAPTQFRDADTGFSVAMASPGVDAAYNTLDSGFYYAPISLTNTFGVNQAYRLYRTANILGGAIDIEVII